MHFSTVSRFSRRPPTFAAAITVTAAAMTGMPTANATCASFFGIHSGGNCTSTLTSVAVAIGQNAQAHADGIAGAALTLGKSSTASTTAGALLNVAVTLGQGNSTNAGGIASLALVAASRDQIVLAGDAGLTSGNIGNLAITLASPRANMTIANGIANVTANIAGSGNVYGRGVGLATLNLKGSAVTLYNSGRFNAIANVFGDNTFASNLEGGVGDVAVNLNGDANALYTKGPLAIAATIGSTGQTVTQSGPGVSVRFRRQTPAFSGRRGTVATRTASGPVATQRTSRVVRSADR